MIPAPFRMFLFILNEPFAASASAFYYLFYLASFAWNSKAASLSSLRLSLNYPLKLLDGWLTLPFLFSYDRSETNSNSGRIFLQIVSVDVLVAIQNTRAESSTDYVHDIYPKQCNNHAHFGNVQIYILYQNQNPTTRNHLQKIRFVRIM